MMVTIWPFTITGDFNSLIRDSKREKGLAVRRVSRFHFEGTEFQKKITEPFNFKPNFQVFFFR